MPSRKYTPDELPEEMVPADLAEKGVYNPAGHACEHCSFVSRKKDFSGRQAMRAHSKKHKRETRAWRRPLVGQFVVVIALLAAAAAGWANVDVPLDLPLELPVVSFQADSYGWTVIGATVVLLLLSSVVLVFGSAPYGGRTLIRVNGACVLLGTLTGLWAIAMAWRLVGPALPWLYHLAIWAPVVMTPALAARAGWVRLLVRRRGMRSNEYTILVKPKNSKARFEILNWWERWWRRNEGKRQGYRCPGCKGLITNGVYPGKLQCAGCGTLTEIIRSRDRRRFVIRRADQR